MQNVATKIFQKLFLIILVNGCNVRANEEDMLSPDARCQLREKEAEEAGSADMVETAQGEIDAEYQRIAMRRVSAVSVY